MAGGDGTRLFPLTMYRATLMAPFFNRPPVEHIPQIGNNVEIGRNVKIEHSVIFSGALIEEGAKIKVAAIGEKAHFDKDMVIQPRSVICDNTLIGTSAGLSQCRNPDRSIMLNN